MAFAEFRYRPLPTAKKIHADPKELLAVVGPWGSGKSTVAATDLFQHCLKYRCDALVVRDTYPALTDSCVTKFMEIYREAGKLNMGPPPTFYWKGDLAGHKVMFRSAENPEDIQKFGSVECGYAWLEEVTPGLLPGGNVNVGIKAEVLSGVIGRVRKWDAPCCQDARKKGDENHGHRRIMCTALPPPSTKHWFHTLFYDQRPLLPGVSDAVMQAFLDQLALYKITPEENKKNLPPNYYELQTALLTSEDQVQRFINGEVGSGYGIAAVYAEQWNDLLHINKDIAPIKGSLIVGIDGGLDASAIIMQPQPSGRMYVLSELITKGLGLEDFAGAVIQHINRLFGPRMFTAYADPAVFARSQNNAIDGATYLRRGGISPLPGPQDPNVRITGVRQWLTRMASAGPLLQVHPRCEMLIEGFRGAYHFKIASGEVLAGKIDKNEFSHPHDALQYPLAFLSYRGAKNMTLPPLPAQKIDNLGKLRTPRGQVNGKRNSRNPKLRQPTRRNIQASPKRWF